MIKGKIIIKDSNEKITGNILKSMGKELKLLIGRKKPRIESLIKEIVREAISSCPEIQSLRAGSLRLDFGLNYDPTEEIISSIVGATYVYFKEFKLSLSGASNALSIYIQPSDFNNLLSSPVANVITENGTLLPWLQWLLTSGDVAIVIGYNVKYGIYENSRSGGAIMIPSGFFRVDPQYSGTVENNFITRALEKYSDKIQEVIRNNI
jgi:hypothetical protein